MMKNIKTFIVYLRKIWALTVYLVVLILIVPHTLSWKLQAFFLFYAFLVFWIIQSALKAERKPVQEDAGKKYNIFFTYLLIFSLLFVLITRLVPFLRFGEAPLGYDSGFYLHTVKSSVIPETTTTRVFYLGLLPFRFLGMPPLLAFYFIYILSQFLIVGGLYFLLRSLNISSSFKLASTAVFLFSVSIIQFLGYWSALGQQMLATGFLLITIALFFRQSLLAILTASLTFLIHIPTFAVLGLFFLLYFFIYAGKIFFQKKHFNLNTLFIFGSGLAIFVLLFFLIREQLWGQIDYLLNHSIFLKNYPAWKLFEIRGGFIDLSNFRFLIIFFLPFSLTGVFNPRIWTSLRITRSISPGSPLILYIMFIILFILSFSPILYQGRFSIIFDLFLIIFAAPSILLLINYFLSDKAGKIILAFLMVSFLFGIGFTVWYQIALISSSELQEIKSLSQVLEPKAIIMVTNSSYTPWIYGFSDRDIIGPGHLYDQWSLSSWVEFWHGTDNEKKFQLLRERPMPLYIYLGAGQYWAHYQDFIRNDPHFIQITPHTWKFKPDL